MARKLLVELRKILRNQMQNIAIFASHNGSFLDTLYNAGKNDLLDINISFVVSNNTNANVIKKAKKYNIPNFVLNDKVCDDVEVELLNLLEHYKCKFIVLSGYMKKIPVSLTNNFTIINSHPALLPNYGGKGMYGRFVHEAVIKNGEKQSGATIHYVSENYDEGGIIVQESLDVLSSDTPESLETKVKKLEQELIIKAIKCLK